MPDGVALDQESPVPFAAAPRWEGIVNWTAAILIAAAFLLAGLWKITDPVGAAARLAQARVPESLSIAAAVGLGTLETFTGVLLLVPRFRRWGAALGTFLLLVFMAFIAVHYSELRGADCSCFPWVKRVVGPGFFAGDATLLLLALAAGWKARRAEGRRPAAVILASVGVFALLSYGFAAVRTTGVRAPVSITAEDGSVISLQQGRIFIYFFDPQCPHCRDAGKRLAALHWRDTKFIGVPTQNPQFGDWFLKQANLESYGPVSKDLDILKKLFPFDAPPAGVAIENGVEKAMLLKFEDQEPAATLGKIGFVY